MLYEVNDRDGTSGEFPKSRDRQILLGERSTDKDAKPTQPKGRKILKKDRPKSQVCKSEMECESTRRGIGDTSAAYLGLLVARLGTLHDVESVPEPGGGSALHIFNPTTS